MQTVTLKLPDVMLQAAQKLAIQNDVTVGQIVRDLLVREVHNTNRAKTSGRTDEELLASLQTLLASDMGAATSWDDLERRLQANGYNLRPRRRWINLASNIEWGTLVQSIGVGIRVRRARASFRRSHARTPAWGYAR